MPNLSSWVCIKLYNIYLPGFRGIHMHCSVSLISLDGCKIFFVGSFIDIWLALHIALFFISLNLKKEDSCFINPVSHQKTCSASDFFGLQVEVTSLVLCYLPQPFAHDCLKELPCRDLTQDFPVSVCEDGISVAPWAKIRKITQQHSITKKYNKATTKRHL